MGQNGKRRGSARGAVLAGGLSVLVLLTGTVGWAWGARISGAVIAPGQVGVSRHAQVVQHPEGGVVVGIHARDGDRVSAGEPLIELEGAAVRTELAIVEDQHDEVMARRGRLEAERSGAGEIVFPEGISAGSADLMRGQEALFRARAETLDRTLEQIGKQIEQIRDEMSGMRAQAAALSEQRSLVGEELENTQSLLDKGLAQAPRVLALRREAAGLDGQVAQVEAGIAQAKTRITGLELEALRAQSERREEAERELRDLGPREMELAERRASLSRQVAELEVRAPVSGIVHEMRVNTPRSVIRPAEAVLNIIPQDRPLIITAHVSPVNVDEVRAGQEVRVRFSSFSSRTTPEILGVLERVSADAVQDERTGAAHYLAEVSVTPEEMARIGDDPLLPGMPAEVFILTGERSPAAYLLSPLTDYFKRAFREG